MNYSNYDRLYLIGIGFGLILAGLFDRFYNPLSMVGSILLVRGIGGIILTYKESKLEFKPRR